MSNQTVRFTNTRLVGNGQGKLVRDADGYVTVPVGGLNVMNTAGEFYTANSAVRLFDKSNSFMRRIQRGSLRGEVGHPKFTPGMTKEAYVNRIMNIDDNNVCAHFKEVWLDPNVIKQADGRAVIAIMAKVCPSGDKMHVLEQSINNPHENLCFSVRGLTNDYYERGQKCRDLHQIITFDYVNEPGIGFAEKYNSPAMESMEEVLISKNEFLEALENSNTSLIATESSRALAEEICNSLEWKLPPNVTPFFTKW